jgi:RNA helicase
MSESKHKNWVFTLNAEISSEYLELQELPSHKIIQRILNDLVETYAFQEEVGEETLRRHYQGLLIVRTRVRKSTLLNKIQTAYERYMDPEPRNITRQLTIEPMKGTYQQALDYVTKSETRVGETYYSKDVILNTGEDWKHLRSDLNLYPWQASLKNKLINTQGYYFEPDDRKVTWIYDPKGGTGKSKFVKYMCSEYKSNTAKFTFGSTNQLRASVISAGPRVCYFFDLMRTWGKEDHLVDLISVIEDIKNGFLTSSMYGKYQCLIMDSPHVIVFSNATCPEDKMSVDRWDMWEIDADTKKLIRARKGTYY